MNPLGCSLRYCSWRCSLYYPTYPPDYRQASDPGRSPNLHWSCKRYSSGVVYRLTRYECAYGQCWARFWMCSLRLRAA